MSEFWHGTMNGYSNRSCRCDPCKGAAAVYREANRAKSAEYYSTNRDRLTKQRGEFHIEHRSDESARSARYYAENGSTVSQRHAAYRSSGRERDARYGLAPGEYESMLSSQDKACALCLEKFGDRVPHVDHDHSCCAGARSCGKCVRGLLCATCNKRLGHVEKDTDWLKRAFDYAGINLHERATL